MSIWRMDAVEMLSAFREGQITPLAALEECTSRITRFNPLLNAVVAMSPTAAAEAEASEARWKANRPIGPLDGIPIVVKDNLAVAGMPATFGSAVFANYVPPCDELPIRRLRAAGAILLAKTNCPEFALEGYTANNLHGVTRNPYELALTPGGSSGGSVAAVAAGLAPLAIGTDGGGSLRRPPAYTGLFGLKPTVGEVARSPGLPQLLLDFEVVGPLARTARDLQLAYCVLAGPDRSDAASRRRVPRQVHPERCRILYAERAGGNACEPEILARCAAAADRFAELGHDVSRADLPFRVDALNELWPMIGQIALANLRRQVAAFDVHASRKYCAMADAGETIEAHHLFALLQVIKAMRNQVSRAFQTYDVIMTPACAAMPWVAEEAYPPIIDGRSVGARGHAVYTGWVNAAHNPAVAVPADFSEGLPVGFQLVGDLQAEPLLLDLATEYEQAFLKRRSWPAMALD